MKARYSLDRNGPRMRKGRFTNMVVTKDLWKRFTSYYKNYRNLTWEEFFQGWQDIAKTIRNEAIYNPLGVKLEKFTGELKLQYLPYKAKAEDQVTSEELGEKVNHLNIDTRGKVAKIKWERRKAVRFNKMLQFYAFSEVREMNKMAKDYISENPNALRISRSVKLPVAWQQRDKQ